MNEKLEKYIKNLSPELQEKANGIKTEEELNAFLADNDLELPEEALEYIAGGGCGTNSGGTYHPEKRKRLDPAYPAESKIVK